MIVGAPDQRRIVTQSIAVRGKVCATGIAGGQLNGIDGGVFF